MITSSTFYFGSELARLKSVPPGILYRMILLFVCVCVESVFREQSKENSVEYRKKDKELLNAGVGDKRLR